MVDGNGKAQNTLTAAFKGILPGEEQHGFTR
jgi:hypothetical protein